MTRGTLMFILWCLAIGGGVALWEKAKSGVPETKSLPPQEVKAPNPTTKSPSTPATTPPEADKVEATAFSTATVPVRPEPEPVPTNNLIPVYASANAASQFFLIQSTEPYSEMAQDGDWIQIQVKDVTGWIRKQ